MSSLRIRSSRHLVTVVGSLIIVVLSTATAAVAGHLFSDVTRFEAQIDAFVGAGCATGAGGGKFLPDDPVQREAVAVWMQRCASRVAHASALQGNSGQALSDGEEVLEVSIKLDPAGGGKQFIRIDATGTVFTNVNQTTYCNTTTICNVTMQIWDDNAGVRLDGGTVDHRFQTNAQSSKFAETLVIGPRGAGTYTFSVRFGFSSEIVPEQLHAHDVRITAIMIPFGSTGGNTP